MAKWQNCSNNSTLRWKINGGFKSLLEWRLEVLKNEISRKALMAAVSIRQKSMLIGRIILIGLDGTNTYLATSEDVWRVVCAVCGAWRRRIFVWATRQCDSEKGSLEEICPWNLLLRISWVKCELNVKTGFWLIIHF